jgi:putative polyhydroxyalkanoate system protein
MSKPVTVTIPHKLTREEAARRIKAGLERLRPKLPKAVGSIEDTWNGDHMDFRAKALMQTVSGTVDVMDDSVRIVVDLPWLLSRVSGKVQKQIENRATKMLTRKKG